MNSMKQGPSGGRKVLFTFVVYFLFLLGCEGVFRTMEALKERETLSTLEVVHHDRWGWVPLPGEWIQNTHEFKSSGFVNELQMQGPPYEPKADASRTRILALGDSHTQATGVSGNQAWPARLEEQLNASADSAAFRTYNTGVGSYNMHQYLLRLMDQGPTVKPDYVVAGFSYATDLFDLIPPEHGGGWRTDYSRVYFDFDASGGLVEKMFDAQRDPEVSSQANLRRFMMNFALVRTLRKTELFMAVGTGMGLWANMEVVLEREVSPAHEYNWKLLKAMFLKMRDESEKLGAKFIVLGIPYLPQVYDEVWASSFGNDDAYARTAAIERVAAFLKSERIPYVDALAPMREEFKRTGEWVHHEQDNHPNPRGHEVIANTVMRSGLIEPVRPQSRAMANVASPAEAVDGVASGSP